MADLRRLPKVDVLAASPLLERFPAAVRTSAARSAIEAMRSALREGAVVDLSHAESAALEVAQAISSPSLKPVVNATGIVLHTGAGRARLAPAAIEAIARVAASHSSVEVDLEDGRRGDRQTHVRSLLCELTGAEDALVVNNCAAAVFLALNTLCSGGEVILSRGQMIEIGGTFRMPDIVRQSGCRLVEVGCTNKTRLSDYQEACGPETKALLRCHPSNFKVVGFAQEVPISELAGLTRSKGLLLIDDMGSGCLVDTTEYGLPRQTRVQDCIADGADVVLASGDKMLGGPQAGLILGRRDLVARMKQHPLARALRVDKLTLAALEATLRLYRDGMESTIPTLAYLAKPLATIKRDAQRLARAFPGAVVEAGWSEIGGGSLPGESLPTWRAGLPAENLDALANRLRQSDPPILSRIENGRVWLDPRTMDVSEVRTVAKILAGLS